MEEEKHINNSLTGVHQVASGGRKSIKGVGRGKVQGTHRIQNVSFRSHIQCVSIDHSSSDNKNKYFGGCTSTKKIFS